MGINFNSNYQNVGKKQEYDVNTNAPESLNVVKKDDNKSDIVGKTVTKIPTTVTNTNNGTATYAGNVVIGIDDDGNFYKAIWFTDAQGKPRQSGISTFFCTSAPTGKSGKTAINNASEIEASKNVDIQNLPNGKRI